MIQKVVKTIQVDKVYPGPYGGAIVVGAPIGECAEMRCKLSSRIVTRLPGQGEFWLVKGTITNDLKHGPQLSANSCKPTDLPSAAYVSSFLAKHPHFRGFAFGRKKIDKLTKKFSDQELVKLLDNGNVQRLTESIKLPIASRLVNAWQSIRNENATICFLGEQKFSPELARKVIALCPENTVERLKKNPYALVCFGGITKNIWVRMEKCSKSLGFSLDFQGRLIGGIEQVLYEHLRAGHTAIKKSDLMAKAEKLLGSNKRAEEGLRLALEHKALSIYPQQPEQLFQLSAVGIIEQMLERRINDLLSYPKGLSPFRIDERQTKHLIEVYNMNLRAGGSAGMNVDQSNAVLMALTNNCSIITGCGGTGKTTVLKVVADIAKALGRKTYLLALAGKAKERLRQATGYKSYTIHAFISLVKKGSEKGYLDHNPLIVIDECSMVGTALFNNLLGLLEKKSYSLLTVGDTDQISPIGFGLVWHRLVKLKYIPRTNLTQVFRQRSSLHEVATKVRSKDEKVLKGIVDSISDWNGEAHGVYFVPAISNSLRDTLFKCKSTVDEILRQQFKDTLGTSLKGVALEARMKGAEDAGEIPKSIILTPHMSRLMPDSGDKINRYLQSCLTPLANSLQLGECRLRVGDPVIVSKNSYDLALFNGTTGTLLSVSTRNGLASGYFRFDGQKERVWLSTDELLDVGMQVAYAVSIHKSQGSEYMATLVTCIHNSPMLDKSLIYTALTRAKQLCLIVGSREVFRAAVTTTSRTEKLQVGFFLSKMNLMATGHPLP